jgi:flagellar assembly factor FliW
MLINSLRFGTLEVPDDRIITMERPILGFEGLTFFCLIEMPELAPFFWFQSTEDPSVAFPVLNPVVFFPDYRIEINSKEIAELEVTDASSVETYVVITLLDTPSDITANLQGPILINTENNRAKQLVLVNSDYRVRHSILEAIETPQQAVTAEREPVGV